MTDTMSLFQANSVVVAPGVEFALARHSRTTPRGDSTLIACCRQVADPAFRKIKGFPVGSDEDILALSDRVLYGVPESVRSWTSSSTTASPTTRPAATAGNP